jgi:hypothetical protein
MAKRGNPNWVKGVSGNPKGKTPGRTIGDTMRALLEEKVKDGNITKKEALVQVIYELSLQGDMHAAKLLLLYSDGPPAQKIEHSGAVGTKPESAIDVKAIINEPEKAAAAVQLIGIITGSDPNAGGAGVDTQQ